MKRLHVTQVFGWNVKGLSLHACVIYTVPLTFRYEQVITVEWRRDGHFIVLRSRGMTHGSTRELDVVRGPSRARAASLMMYHSTRIRDLRVGRSIRFMIDIAETVVILQPTTQPYQHPIIALRVTDK